MSNSVTTLITGAGCTTGQSIIKALQISSLDCRIIAVDANPMSAGLYRADAGYLVPFANSPDYIARIIEICQKEKVDAVMIGSTPEVPVLAVHKQRIESETGAKVIVSDPQTVDICHNKFKTYEFFKQNNIDHPDTINVTDRAIAGEFISRKGLPVILKPHHGCSAKGVYVIHSMEEFDYHYSRHGQPVVLQEYIGTGDQEYTCGLFYDRDRICRGTVIMLRELAYGGTYRGIVDDYPIIDSYIRQIGDTLKPQGPINIQLRLTDRGPIAFEINPRFSCSDAMRAQMGYNAPEAAVRSFIFDQDVELYLAWKKGISMRYMNEILITPEEYEKFMLQGHLSNPVSEKFMGF